MKEYKGCEARKAELKVAKNELGGAEKAQVGNIGRRKIKAAIKDLKEILAYATPEEQKILLQDHIREIRIPKNGAALLEANPEGLLDALGCFEMVTPRGVAKKVRKVKARPESICKLDLARHRFQGRDLAHV